MALLVQQLLQRVEDFSTAAQRFAETVLGSVGAGQFEPGGVIVRVGGELFFERCAVGGSLGERQTGAQGVGVNQHEQANIKRNPTMIPDSLKTRADTI